MSKVSFYIIVVFCLLLQISSVKAQMIYDTLYLDEMVIKSNYIDHNSSIRSQLIDTLTKKNLNNLNLGELLSAESPVFIKSYGKGSLATASFRGTAASHTKVLWNGFELNSPMLGQVDLSLIPNSFFDEVSLDFGGSSMENTSGALGGAINLSSGKKEHKNKIDLSQSVGSYKTYTGTLAINLKLKKLKSSTSVYLNSSENSFRYYNNAIIPAEWQTQQNASYFNRGFVQEFDYKISDHQSLSLKNWSEWDFREIPQIMSNQLSGNNEEKQNNFNSRSILSYKYHKSKTIFQIDAAWFYSNINYLLKTTTAIDYEDTVTYINSTNISNSGFAKAGISHSFKRGWKIKSELSFSKYIINSNNYQSTKSREKYDFLVKISKDFSNIIMADFILRQQYSEDKFTPTTPYLGLLFKPFAESDLFFRISANMNYNLPSLNDLYWFPGGNSELLPEKGVQMDVGFNYSKTYSESLNIVFDINFFNSNISNWIQWVPSDYRYWSARNIENVHARGIESSLSLSGNISALFYKLAIQYAITKSTNESEKAKEGGYAGRQLIYVPVNSGNLFLHLNYKRFYIHWNTQFTGPRNTSLDESSLYSYTLPAFSVSNISVGKKFNIKSYGLELNFKVNNIFNNSYQTILWRPMAGINFETCLSFRI